MRATKLPTGDGAVRVPWEALALGLEHSAWHPSWGQALTAGLSASLDSKKAWKGKEYTNIHLPSSILVF